MKNCDNKSVLPALAREVLDWLTLARLVLMNSIAIEMHQQEGEE